MYRYSLLTDITLRSTRRVTLEFRYLKYRCYYRYERRRKTAFSPLPSTTTPLTFDYFSWVSATFGFFPSYCSRMTSPICYRKRMTTFDGGGVAILPGLLIRHRWMWRMLPRTVFAFVNRYRRLHRYRNQVSQDHKR